MAKTREILSQKTDFQKKLRIMKLILGHFRIKSKNCDPFLEIQRRI